VQSDYLIHQKKPVLGSLFSIGYKPPRVIGWLREMGLPKTASILDIGSGSGLNLKMMHHLGYKNLTGVDPFIKQDFQYTDQFSVLKKDPLELDENKKFDCVMMHHSFEHMVFEREVLLKAKRLLNPQGKLLIRIPIYSKGPF
jgi:2-polyprenyl-3-methyl-5-hydroxy-6-metoxy-1,4-benzoquinol methylase